MYRSAGHYEVPTGGREAEEDEIATMVPGRSRAR